MLRRPRGFTLIEMLVVAAILGILVTAAALSMSAPRQRDVRQAVAHLALLLETAQAETQAGQRQLAWAGQAGGYSFWQAEPTSTQNAPRWQPLSADEVFRSQTLPEGLAITRVAVDGQPLPPGELLVMRRGDPLLFRIVFEAPAVAAQPARHFELRGFPDGRVAVSPAEGS